MNSSIKPGPIMTALLVAGFVGLFSETALNIALGELSHIFHVDATTIQWLATGYFLTLGILVPVTGILMQKYTTRQMFAASLALSITGTLIAALAPSFGVLLTARVIQSMGLAIALPLTQNVIFTLFPPNRRGGAMGLMGLVMLAGPALGPTLAGLILDTLSWQWIFWLCLPFLLFSFIFGMMYLQNVNEVRRVSIDALSVVLSTIGFGGIVYGFSMAGDHGWSGAPVWTAIVAGAIGLVVFGIRQTRMTDPMLNLKAFRHPMFVIGLIMAGITFFNMLSLLVILPLYMQTALLISAFATGLALLPGSLLNCILAPVIGRLFDRYGPRAIITPGTICIAAAYALYTQLRADTSVWVIVVVHTIMMLGIGMVIASAQTNTLNALPKRLYPDGIALTQTFQQVIGAIGIAVMVSVLSAKQTSYAAAAIGAHEPALAITAGTTAAFTVGLLLACANVVLSFFIRKTN